MDMSKTEQNYRGLKDYLRLVFSGFCMGAADLVPGVSGGTMAFIMGIYEDLIHAIHAIDLNFIRNLFRLRIKEAFYDFPWRFLLFLALGLFTALFTLASSLTWALENHPVLVWAFFFGLVLASILVVRKRVVDWRPGLFSIVALMATITYIVMGSIPLETPDAPWFLFISGAIAISATILPGISGAFIMVLLGRYEHLLNAVANRELLILMFYTAGAGLGVMSFARVLRWLFKHYHDQTVAAMIGIIFGALRRVWPWKETGLSPENHSAPAPNILPPFSSAEDVLALGLMALGITVVLLLEYLSNRPLNYAGKESLE